VNQHSVELVREFHKTFSHPTADRPTMPEPPVRELRLRLILEELLELGTAFGYKLVPVMTPEGTSLEWVVDLALSDANLVEAADALTDLDYVVQGGMLNCGLPAPQLVAEVHRSNMSKLGPDGKPLLREDGKVLKGPNYFKPDIVGVLAWATLRAEARDEAKAKAEVEVRS